jgi:hypothetical protein
VKAEKGEQGGSMKPGEAAPRAASREAAPSREAAASREAAPRLGSLTAHKKFHRG